MPKAEVDNGRSAEGYTCNTEIVGRFGPAAASSAAGGYKVHRYVDASGHECAYYDTTLLVGLNAANDPGVWVLDMSNPAAPVRTAILRTEAMVSPHESVVFNTKRGLLAAVAGTPVTAPGVVDIYDVTADCRQPVLRSSLPIGTLGHEGGITPDGNTYYTASLDGGTLTAIDISNPDLPMHLWATNAYKPHGMSLSEDGNRLYLADRTGLVILDTSEVQARVFPSPRVIEISRLTWPTMSTPQVTIPVTIGGKPYLIEVDEFAADNDAIAGEESAGAARIIDIANEMQPRVISNIKLEVNMAENRTENPPDQQNDYGAGDSFQDGIQGYAAHYCEVPQRHEPGVMACTFILSGLRIFDIRDPFHPTEIAYFNGPILPAPNPEFFAGGAYAMSAPTFAPERGEIWYSDGSSGFYAVRVTNGVWPFTKKR